MEMMKKSKLYFYSEIIYQNDVNRIFNVFYTQNIALLAKYDKYVYGGDMKSEEISICASNFFDNQIQNQSLNKDEYVGQTDGQNDGHFE